MDASFVMGKTLGTAKLPVLFLIFSMKVREEVMFLLCLTKLLKQSWNVSWIYIILRFMVQNSRVWQGTNFQNRMKRNYSRKWRKEWLQKKRERLHFTFDVPVDLSGFRCGVSAMVGLFNTGKTVHESGHLDCAVFISELSRSILYRTTQFSRERVIRYWWRANVKY